MQVGSRKRLRTAGQSMAINVVVVLAALAVSSCRDTTQIVLVVDTEMAVPAELDAVRISVAGPTQMLDPINLNVAEPNVPTFPRTLGLTPAGRFSPVTIRIAGFKSMVERTFETIRTEFIDGESLMLRSVLTAACLGVVCTDTETCSLGKCVSVDRVPLPLWPGSAPGRPSDQPTAIDRKTLWTGGWRTCATKGGTVYCWGKNDSGELGNGTPGIPASTRLPILNLTTRPLAIGLGHVHSCICDENHQVWCWGSNATGQLAMGGGGSSLQPVLVAGTDCSQISGGAGHTCVVRQDLKVACWGDNDHGQCGQPESATPIVTPQLVPGLDKVSELVAGNGFTCARTTSPAVLCWGDNSSGQLGNGTLASRSMPERISGSAVGVAEVAAGRFFACVRFSSGKVSCWGQNSFGVLGGAPARNPTPVEIPGIDDAIQISGGHEHACVLRSNRGVSCWGSGQWGQLGQGAEADSPAPVDVMGISNASAIVTGDVHSCARHPGGVSCWGQNAVGQLGDGTQTGSPRPVAVIGL
jgi:alpha-tubulin suppressor-like RCC1 family protein